MKTETNQQQNNQNKQDNQTIQSQSNMKTKIISIPQLIASYILKSLGENNISCQYMGIDQSGRILMQINYGEDQEKLIRELSECMEESEKDMNLILQIVGAAFKEAVLKLKSESLIQNQKN